MGVAVKKLRIGRRREIPEVPLSPFEIATAPALVEGRWKLPDRFNVTRDLVEGLADRPKRQALTFLGTDGVIEPRTFVQIAEGAARWAHLLRESGIEPGDRVLVLVDRCVDWLDVVLGALKAGAIVAPCPENLTSAVLEHRLATSGASFIVASRSCERAIGELSSVPQAHYVDEGRQRRGADAPKNEPTHDTASRDIAFLVWTPGTETAKPVALTHGSIFAARVQAEHWLDAGRGDSVWCTSPISSSPVAWNILAGAWAREATVVLYQGEFDPEERLDLIDRLGPTILCQTPTEYRALAPLRRLDRYQPPRVRRLVSTGDYLDAETIAAFEVAWAMTIHDAYGQIETNMVVANGPEAQIRPGSMGQALPGHHVAVIDAQGNELPASIEGDLAVRGRPPTLFAGYWESPEETKDAFRGDWYLTGDVATSDELGCLWFVGRADDVITSRGRTFGPDEVERVLRGHEAVDSCGVVGVRDLAHGGHYVRAFVVLKPDVEGSEPLEAELRQFVGQVLPEQQVPREVEFVEDLPTMASGSLRRRELRDRPVARRPLWDLPPTSERELEPPPLLPALEPLAEHGLRVVATPEPTLQSAPEPVAAPEPTAAAPMPEPEPAPPRYFVQPVPELEVVAEAAPEPERGPVRQPEPDAAPVSSPEPEPRLVIAPEPVSEPTAHEQPEPELGVPPEPELVVAPEPEPEPSPEPKLVIAPEPVFSPADEPAPETAAETAPDPVVEPDPEPEDDLDHLPDYVVDPSRDSEHEREPPPQFLDVGLPPVTNFPTLGERAESDHPAGQEPRARPPRRLIEASTALEPSIGEPGDEADEMGWMKGLSNRLNAYNLAENEATSPRKPGEDEPEDAETGS